jgi:hypothetical protein
VSLSGAGTQTQGVVLCDQPAFSTCKLARRGSSKRVPEFIIDEVLARLSTLID